MAKNILWAIVTVGVMVLINWGVASFFSGEFIEYSFLLGVVVMTIVWFFNSKGGYASNSVRLGIQARTGLKIEEEKQKFNPTVVFYTAIGYTTVALVITIIYYKDYFTG
ncbi:hypothetical protein GLV98_02560 [Halobacillus litoralis]|uniref:DUF3899 domain-containing protein n=1 Tax=Halobacillus litoralis TaxID=45668 RepID=A0A845E0V2_9BACI|nr:hypothetical protein [Halobacillus litoralis]MYL48343.1 hypothetical protein [Halobacillus litoralis]